MTLSSAILLSPTLVSGVIAASRHSVFVQSTKDTFKPIFMATFLKYLFVPKKTQTKPNQTKNQRHKMKHLP